MPNLLGHLLFLGFIANCNFFALMAESKLQRQLTSYAVLPLTDLSPLACGLKEFTFTEMDGYEELDLDEAPCPVQALHEWLLLNFKSHVTLCHVHAWESLVFVVSECRVDAISKQAAILVFDVFAQERQIIVFK